MPMWLSTNGSKRNSENKEKTKDTKKRSPAFWRPFLVYPGYPPLGVPADLKSAVKKMFNLLNPGICNHKWSIDFFNIYNYLIISYLFAYFNYFLYLCR